MTADIFTKVLPKPTLGSSFHQFPRPLGIFIVRITMYLTDPLFRQALQPIPLTVVRQSVSPLSGLSGGNTELSINLHLLLAVIQRVHGMVTMHCGKDSINLCLLLAIVQRVYGAVNTHCRGGFWVYAEAGIWGPGTSEIFFWWVLDSLGDASTHFAYI